MNCKFKERVKAKFTPRQQRVLTAMWAADGWIWREALDRIAGASNGPEIIRRLRRDYLIEIDMVQQEVIDADGRTSRPGKYRLTEKGRAALVAMGWTPGE
jgi:hypothetical protein